MSDGKLTPMMRQYREIKSRYPDAFLFMRVGDFFELFFDDAVRASSILNITLTSRDKNEKGSIPLAGIPWHAADGYIRKLLGSGHKVVICDQVEDPRFAKGMVKRAVTRVYTPGTVVNPDELDPRTSNYLFAVVIDGDACGVAFADVSCGDVRRFVTTDLRRDVFERFAVTEVVIAEDQRVLFDERAGALAIPVSGLAGDDSDGGEDDVASRAASLLVRYVRDVILLADLDLRDGGVFPVRDHLFLDENSQRDLEVFEPAVKGGGNFSLLGVMDDTVTPMGGRLLRQMLAFPLLDRHEIARRHGAVATFLDLSHLIDPVRRLLKQVADLERIATTVSGPSPSPRHLAHLRDSLRRVPAIREQMAALGGMPYVFELDGIDEAADLVDRAIVDDPPYLLRDGNAIRAGYSSDLDDVRSLLDGGTAYLAEYERLLRERTGIGSLKVGYNRVFGYYIEVSKANQHLVPPDFIRKQTLTNAERYITDELKTHEDRVLAAGDRARELELYLFRELVGLLAEFADRMRRLAAELAQIDVFSTFALNAASYDYCKPLFSDDGTLHITAGRHPFVERTMPGFVPNDTLLDRDTNRIMLITGPNMSGKSTYMRQSALIVLMAQCGSFVPADECVMPVFDQVFTRIGTSDFLASGKSTFMVEMLETARILNESTESTLVVLDEVGRGTSTYDGMAIAWAALEHLSSRSAGPCVMFSTHYHELTGLALTLRNVKNYNVTVREWNGEILFLHRIAPGTANRSYGIHVAKLAGLPRAVIGRAEEILAELEEGDMRGTRDRNRHRTPSSQLPLFSSRGDRVADELSAVRLETMTPLDAFDLLKKLKGMVEG